MTRLLSIQKHSLPAWSLPFTTTELERLFRAMLAEYRHDRLDTATKAALAPELAEQSGEDRFDAEPLLELLLIDDASMERLHRQTFSCQGPTNILSFPVPEGTTGPDYLGSLALSVDTLSRECFLYGQDQEEHCIRLLAHGLAHLLGYDHGDEMQELTNRLESAAAKSLLP